MCMKSVNINNIFFEDDLTGLNKNFRFGEMKDQISAEKLSDGKYKIDRLYIFCNLSAMSSKSEDENLTNVYDVMWIFGCVNNGYFDSFKIAQTSFDTNNNKISDDAVSTRSFCNSTHVIKLNGYIIDKTGRYYLKTYIRKKGTEEWQIQSITSINITEQ